LVVTKEILALLMALRKLAPKVIIGYELGTKEDRALGVTLSTYRFIPSILD